MQARGHEVWVDVDRLSAGVDWEDGIAGALSWVKDAQHDGRVLLLMTPHALRRPDGYCLNEIARAASSRLAIFPVMVADSEPPPAIVMLPFFDLRDCVPSHLALDADNEAWQAQMAAKIHSAKCWDKLQRLFALLELVRAHELECVVSTVVMLTLMIAVCSSRTCRRTVCLRWAGSRTSGCSRRTIPRWTSTRIYWVRARGRGAARVVCFCTAQAVSRSV